MKYFLLMALTLLSESSMADTNYVVYILSTGAKVSYDKQYDISQNLIAPDGISFRTTTSGTDACGILSTTNDPAKVTNISELKNKTILVPGDFLKQTQAAKEITPAVQGLMDAYNKKLIAAGLTNCVVTDADVKIATTNRIKSTASVSLE